MVWSDEFNGAELDPTKWQPEVSCWGGGNNERQCYTDRDDNVQLVNGLLRLVALEEEFTGPNLPPEANENPPQQVTKPYTSGKVRTRDIADWTYGRFSARAKLPAGQGTWPAFWMMPADDVYGTWAASGEIDIMESINLGASCSDCVGGSEENRTSGAIHFGDEFPGNTFLSQRTELPGNARPDQGYHVYSIEWGEGLINWFVDDKLFFQLDSDDWFSLSPVASGNDNAPFDQDFYMMFNLAVGGNYPDAFNDFGFNPNSFPNQLLVDWVRVYHCDGDEATGRSCMDDTILD
ncbi:MAG: hypothetical protein CME93_00405 [Hyphomonadaceae bacterium]|nr:hypothetical protein [Hyphomonadaceae bacterium]